jgi:HAD superfamily hydrolase (TIGR01509 family)
MDGVIVNSHPAHRSAWKQFLHSVGKTVPEDDLDFILDGRKRNEILTYFFGPLCEQQLREYGDRKDAFFQAISPQDEAMPGVDELIIRLKEHRVPMAVATSAGASRTCSTLARLSLLPYFEVIITGSDVREGKPDPSIYRMVVQRLGCPPPCSVAIEDSASGVRSAKAAGLKCIGLSAQQSSKQLEMAGADLTVDSLLSLTLNELRGLFPERSLHRGSRHPSVVPNRPA